MRSSLLPFRIKKPERMKNAGAANQPRLSFMSQDSSSVPKNRGEALMIPHPLQSASEIDATFHCVLAENAAAVILSTISAP